MKKILTIAMALFLAMTTFAQQKTVLFSESFDSNSMPEGWAIMGDGLQNWSVSSSNKAGGSPNEMRFWYYPMFQDGTTRLVSPSIDMTGIESVTFSFKHYIDHFAASPVLGIATSSDKGETWNTAWSQEYTGDGRYNIQQAISTADIGKDNVMFCIFIQCSSTNIDNWYIDDIEILSLQENDAQLISINNMPSIIELGETEISFTMKNMGLADIESFEASYEIGEIIHSETFNTDMPIFETQQFSFQQAAVLTPGIYDIKVNITKVNGNEDENTIDNMKEKSVIVALGHTGKIPMIEHFSSSTCGPCAYLNTQMDYLTANNPGKYTYVKYPLAIPTPGDPYNTEEVNIRKEYYGVKVAPEVIFNANNIGSSAVSQSQIDGSYNSNAYVNIRGAFDVEGNTINIIADVMSYAKLENKKVFVSVNEKVTTENASYNGETEFHHIMMKMMEDANGNDYTLNAGKYQRYEFSYDMSETFVEDMNDLEVAVWVQDYDTREIFNSKHLYEYQDHKYPVNNLQVIKNEGNLEITWEVPEEGNPSGYDIYVNNTLVQANTMTMAHTIDYEEEFYIIEVVALYDDMTSIGVIVENYTEEEEEEICLAPVNLNAVIEQDAEGFDHNFRVTLSWDAVENANQYALYLDGELLDETTETSYIKGFDEEGEHYFTVATICENGESEQSEAFSFELLGVSINEYENFFELYPNPAENKLYFKTNEIVKEINIYNITGVKVYSQNNINTNRIDVSNLNDGIYFIGIKTEDNEIVRQFIKQ